MKLVGSGLGHHADDGGGVAAKLRAEVVGLHIVLADGIRVWDLVAAVAKAGHVQAAIEIVRNLACEVVRGTVDIDVILNEPRLFEFCVRLHSRREAEQCVGVAIDQRQIVDLYIGYAGSERRIAQIDQRNVGSNADRLALTANLKHHIQSRVLHDGEDDTAALERLEAGSDNGDLVGAHWAETLRERFHPPLEVETRTKFVSVWVSVIFAFGTTAPVGSVIVPERLAVLSCADAPTAVRTAMSSANSALQRKCVDS